MRTVDVVLGGQTYTVAQLRVRANAEWRRQLTGQVRGLLRVVPQWTAQLEPMLRTTGQSKSEVVTGALRDETLLSQVGQFVGLGEEVLGGIEEALDALLDLLCAYSPVLAAARERIEGEAYEDEVLAAFLAVVKLSLPFGPQTAQLWKTLNTAG